MQFSGIALGFAEFWEVNVVIIYEVFSGRFCLRECAC